MRFGITPSDLRTIRQLQSHLGRVGMSHIAFMLYCHGQRMSHTCITMLSHSFTVDATLLSNAPGLWCSTVSTAFEPSCQHNHESASDKVDHLCIRQENQCIAYPHIYRYYAEHCMPIHVVTKWVCTMDTATRKITATAICTVRRFIFGGCCRKRWIGVHRVCMVILCYMDIC